MAGGRIMKLRRLLLVAMLASAVHTLAQADNKKETSPPAKADTDWPIFRGNPLQTGVAGAPLPDKLTIRWKFKAKDAVEGSAAIANGLGFELPSNGELVRQRRA